MEFNLNEIFEMARHVEKSGYTFYKRAAKEVPEQEEFLNFLASEEVKHESVFDKFRERAVDKEFLDNLWDPDDTIAMYFQSMANSLIFKPLEDMDQLFDGDISLENIMDWAIQREKETVLFFTGIRESLKDQNVIDEVQKIINEEIRHISILMSKKEELGL